MQLTRQMFDLMNEVPLQKEVLIPLFRAMGFRDVKHYHGGPNELGKDIVMWREEELRERVNYGVVVKAEKITGQASGAKNSANEVLFQVMQAFNEPYPDLSTGEEQTIHRCLVVSSKEVSKEAINAIKGTLRKDNLDKITTFIDGETLWGLIEKYTPEKGVLEDMQSAKSRLEGLLEEHGLSEHFHLVADTEGVFELRLKHPEALKEHPLSFPVKFKFDTNKEEGRAALEEFKRALATGGLINLKSPYVAGFQMPDFMERLFGFTPESMEVTIGQVPAFKDAVKMVIECDDGERAQVDCLLLENVQSGPEQMTLSNERQEASPWKLTVRVDRVNHQSQFTVNFNPAGFNVKQGLDGYRFLRAMSKGGHFVIESYANGFHLGEQQIAAGAHPAPDAAWVELCEEMLFIQKKTYTLLKCPDKVSNTDAQLVFALANVLRTGHAQVESAPWEVRLPAAHARRVLEDFGDGTPRRLIIDYDPNQIVEVFGVGVPLGPVVYRCDEALMTNEDAEALRSAIEAGGGEETFTARITPAGGQPFEAIYLAWAPAEERESIFMDPAFRARVLQASAQIILEATKHEGVISINGFIKELAEVRGLVLEDGSVAKILNPLAGSTQEELQVALAPVFAGLEHDKRLELAAKLVREGLLSSVQAAESIGMGHDEFAAVTADVDVETPDGGN